MIHHYGENGFLVYTQENPTDAVEWPHDLFLALTLLMFRIAANHHHASMTLDDPAFFTNPFYRSSHFHGLSPLCLLSNGAQLIILPLL
jgi:hypothetical protein